MAFTLNRAADHGDWQLKSYTELQTGGAAGLQAGSTTLMTHPPQHEQFLVVLTLNPETTGHKFYRISHNLDH